MAQALSARAREVAMEDSDDPIARWSGLAACVGVILAPAGLNFSTPSTTVWPYRSSGWSEPWLRFAPIGDRIPFDAESLRGQATALRLVDALWARALARSGLELPPSPPELPLDALARIEELGIPGLLPLLLRADGLLERLRFCPRYHETPALSPPLYLWDMAENGLALFLVEEAGQGPTERGR